jgi:NitT/TauT family transport system ATP-binding protein
MTALFVTHDLEEALFLSDRVVVMSRDPGRIIRSVDVPFGRPRDRSIRTEPEFQQLRADLSAELRAVAGDLEAR